MLEIDLEKERPTRATILSYGALRTGKTEFLSTFPRPLIIADRTESGWRTVQSLRNRNPNKFYEPRRPPIVWVIESPVELLASYPKIEQLVAKGEVLTVGLDSVTFYGDTYLGHLKGRKGSFDPRQHYGEWFDHIVYVRQMFHALPVNIVWTALDAAPDKDSPRGLPLMPGRQAAQSFPGACDYVFYHRTQTTTAGITYEIHTRAYLSYPAGGRDAGALPNPLGFYQENEKGPDHPPVFVPDCTYQTFAEHIGLQLPPTARGIDRTSVEEGAAA